MVACPRGATPSRSSRSRAEGLRPHRDPLLRLIGLFKLVKGVILLAAGVGAVYLSRDGAMDTFSLWIGGLPLHPGNRWIVQPLATLLAVNPRTLRAVGLGTFVYAAIFVALSAATSRGLVIGLGYSLIWEGILAGALPGTQLFSVREYLRGIVAAIGPKDTLVSVVGAQGFLLAAVAFVVVTTFACIRLARFEIRAAD